MISRGTVAGFVLAAALFVLSAPATADDKGKGKPAAEPPKPAALTPKRLDLRAPDITKIFSAAQLSYVLSKTLDPSMEEIEVEGRRSGPLPPSSPTVWPAIAAPFWAIAHPTQAWRIVAPMPPDQASRVGGDTPDATDPTRAPKIPQ